MAATLRCRPLTGPILVTGGAGFVGSHVVEALIHAGYEVRVLDHRQGPEGAEWIEGDVRDSHSVAAAVARVGAVCHQAAMSETSALGDAPDLVAVNDFGTAVLLTGLADRRFAGRLVLGSSAAVYGAGVYACPGHGGVRPPTGWASRLPRTSRPACASAAEGIGSPR